MPKADEFVNFRFKPKKRSDFDVCAEQLKALADPLRLRIVYLLFDGPLNVSQICEAVDCAIVKVSHHLGALNDAGIVQRHRDGRNIIHSLNPAVAEIRPKVLKLTYIRLHFAGGKPKLQIAPPSYPWQ